MTDLYVRTFLVANDHSCREKIEAISTLSDRAQSIASNDSARAFAVCVPLEPQGGALPSNENPLTILIIERYPNESSRNLSEETKFIAQCEDAHGSLFKTVSTTVSRPEISFTRDTQLAKIRDPYIITASFLYQQGKAQDALQGWHDFVEYTCQHEEEAYTYAVFQLLDSHSTLEVYSGADFVAKVHLKSPAIQANNAQNGSWRVPHQTFATKWQMVAGFLYRS